MIAGIITPLGNLGALTPQQVCVKPIAAEALAVGDLVQFDLASTSATYTAAADLTEFDSKKCPFNVVIKTTAPSAATNVIAGKGGIFGVVTQAAAAGQRCEVCVAGVVDAKVTVAAANSCDAGESVLTVGTGVLVPAPATPANTTGAPVALALATIAASSGTSTIKVLLGSPWSLAVGGA
jgi:hypothetical protein